MIDPESLDLTRTKPLLIDGMGVSFCVPGRNWAPRAAGAGAGSNIGVDGASSGPLGGLMMRRLPEAAFGLCLLAMLAISPCMAAAPVAAPNLVYVSDFDLELAQVRQSASVGVPKPAPLSQRLGYGRPRTGRTPAQQARHLVDLMSRSLLDDLHRSGIPAQRLASGAPLPSSGWLVRGAFLEVDGGGRLRRSVGFGAGSAPIEVVAAVDQLGAAAPRPLYTIDGTAQSAKLPDAVVTLNPNIALGRFVLTRRDLDRNVKAAAEDIAGQVEQVKK